MASATEISYALAAAMLDNAVNTTLNEGTDDAIINIYTGAPPADCETAPSGTLLGTCIMNTTPFIAAANQNPNAMIDENAITDDSSADTGGTAGYFRVYSTNTPGGEAGKLNCHIQGTAGVSGDTPDLTLDDKVIVVGGTISVTDYQITLPEYGGA
jgi:hypothetical protein